MAGLLLAACSQLASSLLLALTEIVGWASIVCLQDATACCSIALPAPPPVPVVAEGEVLVAGAEGVAATVGPAVAGARPGAGAEAVAEGVVGEAVRVPAAAPLGAPPGLLPAGVEDVPAPAGPVLAAAPPLAAEPLRAAAGLAVAGVELVTVVLTALPQPAKRTAPVNAATGHVESLPMFDPSPYAEWPPEAATPIC